MNLEQKLVIVYSFIGIASGFISNFFTLLYAVSIPLVVYAVSFVFLVRFCKHKKILWLISNSFITFVLVWLVAWIFIYNLW